MSRILDFEKRTKKHSPVWRAYGEIDVFRSLRTENNPKNLSQEANELLTRLNELANENPFNIIYRAKINDPH